MSASTVDRCPGPSRPRSQGPRNRRVLGYRGGVGYRVSLVDLGSRSGRGVNPVSTRNVCPKVFKVDLGVLRSQSLVHCLGRGRVFDPLILKGPLPQARTFLRFGTHAGADTCDTRTVSEPASVQVFGTSSFLNPTMPRWISVFWGFTGFHPFPTHVSRVGMFTVRRTCCQS